MYTNELRSVITILVIIIVQSRASCTPKNNRLPESIVDDRQTAVAREVIIDEVIQSDFVKLTEFTVFSASTKIFVRMVQSRSFRSILFFY